jgi:hypothetical protein
MKRKLKWLGSGLLGLIVLFVAAGWWLHGNLDAIVKRAIVHYGSQITQARVKVDEVRIRSTDGAGSIRGLVVGNPEGFRTSHALKVGVIEVAVDIRTLADPVVVVRRIVVESPDLIYEKGDTQTNFEAIQRNIARSLGSGGGTSGSSSSPGRRLIVEELIIRNARAQAATAALGGSTMSTTLPDITLRNVGRAQGGVTPGQLGEIVARALSQRLVASLSFDRALKSLGDRVKGLLGR